MDNRTLTDRLARIVEQGRVPGLHAVVAARHGEVILEHYGEGEDFRMGEPLGHVRFTPDTLHDVRSVTKSVVGLLYGIALADDRVPEPHEPLLRHFPEYPDLVGDPRRAALTIEHALTMTLGLEWDESAPYTSPANSEIAMELAPDRFRYILERPVVEEPGTRWSYCGGASALVARLVERGTGLVLEEFARARLFEPLGIERFEWSTGADGVALAASGLRLTPRGLLAVGRLVLDGGRDVVPASWLAEALYPRVRTDRGSGYGYQWYVGDTWVGAFGNGGQRIYVAPELDLVVAVTAGQYNLPEQPTASVVLEEVVLAGCSAS
ncbi:CubicO group peptidase (beta-lactamase class C family) [Streptosporangium becharense]|uniref:CubicO group peptidase (Beta-lactamase class C family) n=1 Tax=Streptosporangium becharense TaxID=1816182 RepID=A0A7W9MIP3_9ACTN|nr:serine hydrolase domain-containing protein [Streptosporangium becharense]MBB2911288.1 CubicO group peptidase (beta-lactamase class C family) [Streptosporangium becharense]MBB5821654.1 CubicO group peptidase (beta-lactamase class C family) [Streptosporangium becharense]